MYPIKALRAISLDEARLDAQGVEHDRRFMLYRIKPNGELTKVQLSSNPECGLFSQEIIHEGDGEPFIRVRYHVPAEDPPVPHHPLQDVPLDVPWNPDLSHLERGEFNLLFSAVNGYRMGQAYDDWFTACFGFKTVLAYIGDQRRPVLGTFAPQYDEPRPASTGWLSSLAAYAYSSNKPPPRRDPPWLSFADVAPYLITNDKSLRNVSARISDGDVEMWKFRPNIAVDADDEFEEDFWSELSLNGQPAFSMTKLCNRCTSLNVDYDTGRQAKGDRGIVLKKLMSDRRVDPGIKWVPCFGKYGYLARGVDELHIRVGDDVAVTERAAERPVWDWPMKSGSEVRFYQHA